MVLITSQQTFHSQTSQAHRQNLQDNVILHRISLGRAVSQPSSKNGEKVQKLLPYHNEAQNVVLRFMQHRTSEERFMRERVHRGWQSAVGRGEFTEIGGEE